MIQAAGNTSGQFYSSHRPQKFSPQRRRGAEKREPQISQITQMKNKDEEHVPILICVHLRNLRFPLLCASASQR